jgi:hypothetical protein
MKKIVYTFFILIYFIVLANAQCQTVLPFSSKAVSKVNDIFQFTFLHNPPSTRLDTLVIQLQYPIFVIDSSFFNWPKDGSNVRSNIDVFNAEKVMEAIAALKTNEAFFILYYPYYYNDYAATRDMHKSDDLSPYNGLLSSITYYKGTRLLNKYFLNSAVPSNLPQKVYDQKVLDKCKQLSVPIFKNIKYCVPLQGDNYALAMMKKENSATCDSAIIKLINKYTNNNTINKGYYSLDSIMIELYKMPLVIDAQADNCVPQVAMDDGNSYVRLGVIYDVGEDWLTKQKKYILRVYTIKSNNSIGSSITNIDWSINFVSRTRQLCNGEE